MSQANLRPVFIVGMPRFGTSLVMQILTSHPDIAGAGKVPFLERFGLDLASGKQQDDDAYTGSSEEWRRYQPWLGGAFDGLV